MASAPSRLHLDRCDAFLRDLGVELSEGALVWFASSVFDLELLPDVGAVSLAEKCEQAARDQPVATARIIEMSRRHGDRWWKVENASAGLA